MTRDDQEIVVVTGDQPDTTRTRTRARRETPYDDALRESLEDRAWRSVIVPAGQTAQSRQGTVRALEEQRRLDIIAAAKSLRMRVETRTQPGKDDAGNDIVKVFFRGLPSSERRIRPHTKNRGQSPWEPLLKSALDGWRTVEVPSASPEALDATKREIRFIAGSMGYSVLIKVRDDGLKIKTSKRF